MLELGRVITGVIILLSVSRISLAQVPRSIDNKQIPDAIRAMNFDSVLVLAKKYPKSPLVIGYQRVLRIDTNDYIDEGHPEVTIDSMYLLHGKLLNRNGKVLLPYTFYPPDFFEKPGCSRALMYVSVTETRYVHDFPDSLYGFQYLFDVMREVAVDSGWFKDFGSERYLMCRRYDRRTNFIDPCDGHVYRYDDPFTLKIRDVWYHKGVLRLIVRDSVGSVFWKRICSIDKKQTVPITWESDSGIFSEEHLERGFTDLRIAIFNVNGTGWSGIVDPATGRFGPEKVLNFDLGRWWFCTGYESGCISKMRLEGMQNRHPLMRINSAKIRLTLTDKESNRVVYKQNHWVNVGLEPGEVGATQEFQLNQQVFVNGDLIWNAEVLEYR